VSQLERSFTFESKEDERVFLEALENSQGHNCEHVVPQSWFSKKNPMRGDLHHLYSCLPNCNSFRGNSPYIEFPDWEEKVMDDCGMRELQRFEPKEGKGAVARATLYFLLRYPGMVSQYNEDDIITLLTWHVNEKPGLYELHRNAAIEELQGNRNPLIDFPNVASKVDFRVGLA
jgi:endonuclease I